MTSEHTRVESPYNPRLKLARSLSSTRGVRKAGRYLLEGPRFVGDAIARGGIDYLILSDTASSAARAAAERGVQVGLPCLSLPATLYDEVSDTVTAQGLAAVCLLPEHRAEDLLRGDLVLALDGVSDPGNVGTAIRSAAGLGASGVALLKGSACAFVPKATRASAGANAAIPVIERLQARPFLTSAIDAGWKVLAAKASGDPVTAADRAAQTILLIGSEAHGIGNTAARLAHGVVSVPVTDRVESLNAAASAAILLYVLAGRGR
jgi:TrmH family RNA methyltransferase